MTITICLLLEKKIIVHLRSQKMPMISKDLMNFFYRNKNLIPEITKKITVNLMEIKDKIINFKGKFNHILEKFKNN